MSDSILIAIITVCGSLITGSITYLLAKNNEINLSWRHEKMNHYKVLLTAISDLATDGTDIVDANMRFVMAVNTICLVSPQYVITALMEFHDEIKISNQNRSIQKHDELLINLLLSIRKDIGLAKNDNRKKFVYHLIGAKPKKNYK